MKNLKEYITETYNISNRIFIKALKEYGELTHDDLIEVFNDYDDNPLMIHGYAINSMYVASGNRLCLCYIKDGREYEFYDENIEGFDKEKIDLLYDYITIM